jgi:hypothetical protein
MTAAAITVEGLDELRRALKKAEDVDALAGIKAANRDIGLMVVAAAKTRAFGVSRMAASAAQTLRATNTAGYAGVRLGSAAKPFAAGAEFGSIRYRQFKPWRGSGAGYFLYPTVRDKTPEIINQYADAIVSVLVKEK